MVVWLASYPRSGNTLARIALHHLYGLETGSLYPDRVLVEAGAAETVGHVAGPAPLEAWAGDGALHFVKTHEPASDDGPALYVVRDGRDALVSHAHYMATYAADLPPGFADGPGDPAANILRPLVSDGHPAYGTWSDHVLGWLDRSPAPAVVRYEELATDPEKVLAPAFKELRLTLPGTGDPMPSFEELHRRWPGFFRRGVAGGWRSVMDDELERLFWSRHGEAMERLGYR